MKRRLHGENSDFILLRDSLDRSAEELRQAGAAADGAAHAGQPKAGAKYREIAQEYVLYCLSENIQPDRGLMVENAFEDALIELSRPDEPTTTDNERTVLAPSTLAALLYPLPPVADMLAEAGRRTSAHDIFSQQTPLRRILRQWAERTRTDPFVSQCLRDAADQESIFHRSIMDADARMNGLRMKYEIQRHRPDRLSVERGSDGKAEIVAVSAWSHIADAFPADVEELFTLVATVELAIGRLTRAAEDIDREVSRCVSEAIVRTFTLLLQMPRGRRRQFTGGRSIGRRRMNRLIAAATSTDFTTEGNLAVYQKALPRRLRVLTADPSYERVRARVFGEKVHDASTVVAGPVASQEPAPSGE